MKKTIKVILCFSLIAVVFALEACSNQKAADYNQYEKYLFPQVGRTIMKVFVN